MKRILTAVLAGLTIFILIEISLHSIVIRAQPLRNHQAQATPTPTPSPSPSPNATPTPVPEPEPAPKPSPTPNLNFK